MEQKSNYLAQRVLLVDHLSKLGPWECVDHWPLFAGQRNIFRFIHNLSLLDTIIHVPGDLIEVGCWRGSNTMLFAKALDFKYQSSKKIVVFDSFEGLQNFSASDEISNEGLEKSNYRGNFDLMNDVANLYNLSDKIEFYIGDAELTIPEFSSEQSWRRFSLIYFDADLYDACKVSLECLWEMLSIGGLFVFDEWNMRRFPGESNAVNNFFKSRSDYEMQQPILTDAPSLIVKKIS